MIRNYFVGTMAASVVTLFGTCALAQHEGDIEFGTDASGGALIVAGWVFEGEFGDFGTSFFTDEPGFEAVEAFFPEAAIAIEPVVDALKGLRFELARAPLRLAPATGPIEQPTAHQAPI